MAAERLDSAPAHRRSHPSTRAGQRASAAAVCLSIGWLAACASAPPPGPAVKVPAVASELMPPSEGYPLAADPAALRALDAAFERLRSGDREARRDGETRLARDPGFHAAAVLVAEADLLAGQPETAIERLQPVVAELPEYDAARVALGAAAVEGGQLPLALESYAAVANRVPAAAAKVREVKPRALEIVRHRFDDALARGRLADAEAQHGFLIRWAPDEESTWQATRVLAQASHDERRELMAVRRLAAYPDAPGDLKENLARLEVEAGDAAAGVRLYEELVRRSPANRELAERLDWAKFRFRLDLLPGEVRSLAAAPQLSRAGFAAVLYWLAPEVRYGKGGTVRIADDILETAHRDEVMRVLNLGLLDVDETLHKFYPEAPIARGDALAALLRLMAAKGGAACVNGLSPRAIGRDSACGLAAGCGLESEAAGCLPGAPLSGAEAADLIRRVFESTSPR